MINPTPHWGRWVVYRDIVDTVGRNWSSLVSLRRTGPYAPCMLGSLSVDAGRICQLPGLLAPKNPWLVWVRTKATNIQSTSIMDQARVKPKESILRRYKVRSSRKEIRRSWLSPQSRRFSGIGTMTSSGGHQIELRIFEMILKINILRSGSSSYVVEVLGG